MKRAAPPGRPVVVNGIVGITVYTNAHFYATASISVLLGFTGCPEASTAPASSLSTLFASMTVERAASLCGLPLGNVSNNVAPIKQIAKGWSRLRCRLTADT